MSNIPDDLRYTSGHEWVRNNGDGTYTVGITDHAQELLGDLVFVEVPPLNDSFEAGNECAVVESVKAASDVYCPLDGEIVAVNEALDDTPETINSDPYQEGWIFTLRGPTEEAFNGLLDAAAYSKECEND
jgi:glycine cleavage system H protein